jgi:hypothetical protein
MIRRAGCLAPIAFVFVMGCLFLIGGLVGESQQAVRAGGGMLAAAVLLLVLGWWLRRSGWWA